MNYTADKLVSRFRFIDADRMKDLPIYNSALHVEAIDFQQIDIQPSVNALIGALITPWFINIILIDIDTLPPAQLGQRVSYRLPSGDHAFMVGEDEELGRYDFLSVASPVLKYKTQSSAQQAARKSLQKLLTPEKQIDNTDNSQAVHFDPAPLQPDDIDPGRRALLAGRAHKPDNA